MNEATGFGAFFNSVALSAMGVGMSFAVAWFWYAKNQAVAKAAAIAAGHEKLLARMAATEAQLGRIDQVIVPINTMMQALLVKQLTHAHTPEMDILMIKLGPPSELTPAEEKRLLVLLEERTRDMSPLISPEERGAAVIMPVIMERAKVEQQTIANAQEVGARLLSVVSLVAVPLAGTTASPGGPDKP